MIYILSWFSCPFIGVSCCHAIVRYNSFWKPFAFSPFLGAASDDGGVNRWFSPSYTLIPRVSPWGWDSRKNSGLLHLCINPLSNLVAAISFLAVPRASNVLWSLKCHLERAWARSHYLLADHNAEFSLYLQPPLGHGPPCSYHRNSRHISKLQWSLSKDCCILLTFPCW